MNNEEPETWVEIEEHFKPYRWLWVSKGMSFHEFIEWATVIGQDILDEQEGAQDK